MRIRTYSEMRQFVTIEERFDYLQLAGQVGAPTFGYERYLNQRFYTSREWRHIRNEVIARDEGCDLGIEGYEIHDRIIIHHMNPLTVEHLDSGEEAILDPEFLISTSLLTHNAIHFGNRALLPKPFVPRSMGDTKLW